MFIVVDSVNNLSSEPAIVYCNVLPPILPSAPKAYNVSVILAEDITTKFSLLSSNPNVTYSIISLPPKGQLSTCASNCIFNAPYNLSGNSLWYIPAVGDFTTVSPYTFEYSVCLFPPYDELCSNATVSLNITFVNYPPVAYNIFTSLPEDSNITINLNATNVQMITDLTYFIVSWNGAGVLANSDGIQINPSSNPLNIALPNGIVTYTPPIHTSGPPFPFTTFTYYALNSYNGSSNIATVSINVTRVNYPPIASAANPQLGKEFENSTIVLHAIDWNADAVQIKICSLPLYGELFQTNGSLIGVESVVSDSTTLSTETTAEVTYYAANASFDFFSFRAISLYGESSCFNVTINVTPAPRPEALGSSLFSTLDDNGYIYQFLGSVNETGVTLSFYLVSLPNPSLGSLYQVEDDNVTTNQTIQIGESVQNIYGLVAFIPLNLAYGNTSFSYRVCDSHGICSKEYSVQVNVEYVNHPPVAYSQTVTLSEDSSQIFSILGYDEDPRNALNYYINSSPSTGTLQICLDSNCSSLEPATQGTLIPLQLLLFTPPSQVYGSNFTSFTFYVNDTFPSPLSSNIATVTFDVNIVDYPPVAVSLSQSISTDEYKPVLIYFNGTDINFEPSSLTVIILSTFPGSLETLSNTTVESGIAYYSPLIYYPTYNPGNTSLPFAVINYQIQNPLGNLSQLATVNVYVTNVYKAPIPVVTSALGNADYNTTISTLCGINPNPEGNNESMIAIILTLPSIGTLFTSTGEAITENNTIIENCSSGLIYSPPIYQYGFPLTSFNYSLQIGEAESEATTLNISVNQGSKKPVIGLAYVPTIYENHNATIQLFATDYAGFPLLVYFQLGTGGTFYNLAADNVTVTGEMTRNSIITSPNLNALFVPESNYWGYGQIQFGAAEANDTFQYYAEGIDALFIINEVYYPPITYNQNVSFGNTQAQPSPLSLDFTSLDADYFTVHFVELPKNGTLFCTEDTNTGVYNVNQTCEIHGISTGYYLLYYSIPYEEYGLVAEDLASFSYYVVDQYNYTSGVATVSISYYFEAYEPLPSSTNPAVITFTEDIAQNVSFFLNASDPGVADEFIFYNINPLPLYGTVLLGYYFNFQTSKIDHPISKYGAEINYDPYTVSFPLIFDFLAPEDYNTGSTPLQWCWELSANGVFYHASYPSCYEIVVTATNDPPSVSSSSSYTTPVGSVLSIYNISVSDPDCTPDPSQCTNFNVSISLAGNGTGSILMDSVANLLQVVQTSNFISFSGTLPNIQAAFSSSLLYTPPSTTLTAQITVTVFDNGNIGTGNVLSGSTTFSVYTTTSSSSSSSSGPTMSAAFAGGTSVISGSIYGIYRLMKKKKLLPEDSNPWETDEGFDNTQDNPLYNGIPTTSTAASVTLVTND